MKQNNGGPACSVCGLPATHLQGHQHLCPMHYRFGQMRAAAKRHGKAVPSRKDLNMMVNGLKSMRCPRCDRGMNWLQSGGADTVVTLQHYRSGGLGLLCLSCNVRHAFKSGDSFMQSSEGSKPCPKCLRVFPLSSFWRVSGRRFDQRHTYCPECSGKRLGSWRRKNRESYNAYQRQWRASKKRSSDAMLAAREKGHQ